MINLEFKDPKAIENLPMLLAYHEQHGGMIVEYRRVWSLLFVSHMTSRLEWVPPGESRLVHGLKHTLFCFFLGWWSLGGFFATIGALVNNLMGGIDVTPLCAPQEDQSREEWERETTQHIQAQEKLRQVALVFALFLIMGIILFFGLRPFVH